VGHSFEKAARPWKATMKNHPFHCEKKGPETKIYDLRITKKKKWFHIHLSSLEAPAIGKSNQIVESHQPTNQPMLNQRP